MHKIYETARLAAFATLALGLVACGPSNAPKQASSGEAVRVDGSSTVFVLSEAIAEAFSNEATGGARATVGESGTGGGFRKFCRGETDVQGASRPILATEMEACATAGIQYVEVPIAFDGLTVVVHPSNPVSNITVAELKRVWEPAAQGTITNWRQVNRSFPDTALQLFGAGTASGTFDYFTEAVVGTAKSSRTDYTPSEDDNVTVTGVTGNPGAMGYFGYAYFDANRTRLKALSINGVAPTPETIAGGSYPLSRPLFIYISAEALRRPAIQRFAQFYVANAARMAPEVGYAPLPADAYEALAARVREIQTGTAFGGQQDTSASIAEVLSRPLATAPAGPAQ